MSLASTINNLLPRALQPVEIASARYLRWSRHVVQTGPFRGLRYIDRACGSAHIPKIAGTYEKEIHSFLPQFLANQPDAFIDIGAAEGYYAVGAAVANWSPRIVAFEINPDSQRALTELMTLNQLAPARIDLRGACTLAALNTLLADCARPAVLMDVEGYECFLLDPLRVPHLARCSILVEYHDFILHGLRAELCRRMAATHAVTVIDLAPRQAEDLVCDDPIIRRLPASIRRRVLNERRPFSLHGWLMMTPLNSSSS